MLLESSRLTHTLNRCPPNFEWPVEAGPYLSSSFQDYGTIADAVKDERIGSSPYWYLFVIGRDPSHRGDPVAPRLILPFVQKAKEKEVPLWLEATSERSKRAYEKLGFKVVEEMKIGKGQCDSNGNLVVGGEGLSMWAMICDHT
jgi:ribosomal protein S18 acetylase RimI-like enzyme